MGSEGSSSSYSMFLKRTGFVSNFRFALLSSVVLHLTCVQYDTDDHLPNKFISIQAMPTAFRFTFSRHRAPLG